MLYYAGFKTPLGILTIAGIHVLPVWLYGYQYEVLSQALSVPHSLQILGILVLAAGRVLGLAVEVRGILTWHYYCSVIRTVPFMCVFLQMWCILTHVNLLLLDDKEETKD